MTKENYTHISLIVDRSGSMESIRKDSEGGINTLIKDQATVPGDCTVSLYQFDDVYEHVFGPVPAADAPKYKLTPRSSTALLDATGKAIAQTGEFLEGLHEDLRPDRVIFVVVTDGQENASKEYNKEQVRELVTRQNKDYNWEFIFLGANVDAFAESRSLGFTGHSQYAATMDSASGVYAGASRAIRTARVAGKGASVAAEMTDVDEKGNPVAQDTKHQSAQ